MVRAALPFVFEIVVPREDIKRTQTELQQLAAQVRLGLPDAAMVVISTAMGVSVLTAQNEALDLSALPWEVVDALTTLLGTGCWILPGPGIRGSEVKAAWQRSAKSDRDER